MAIERLVRKSVFFSQRGLSNMSSDFSENTKFQYNTCMLRQSQESSKICVPCLGYMVLSLLFPRFVSGST